MAQHHLSVFPDGSRIVWKPLTWADYHAITKAYGNQENWAAEWRLCDAIAAQCILDAEQNGEKTQIDDLYAGTVIAIGRLILERSGFIPNPELIQKHKAQYGGRILGNWYEGVKSLIMHLFRIPETEINQWSIDQFMTYAVRAEVVMGQPIQVLTQEDIEKQNQQQQRFTRAPDGRLIPLLSKQDVTRKDLKAKDLPEENEVENAHAHMAARDLHPSKLRKMDGSILRVGRRR